MPLAVLALPFVDLLLAVFRRVRRGRSPFAPDKQHLHHRLLELGHSHRRAVLLLYFWSALLAFAGVGLSFKAACGWSSWTLAGCAVVGHAGLGRARAARAAAEAPTQRARRRTGPVRLSDARSPGTCAIAIWRTWITAARASRSVLLPDGLGEGPSHDREELPVTDIGTRTASIS